MVLGLPLPHPTQEDPWDPLALAPLVGRVARGVLHSRGDGQVEGVEANLRLFHYSLD